ncbi:zinc finger protein 26-like [Leptidea sinapis]|uniref:zinc finger protein 26-like n=1 Tax=Leptidea sinapis TaxID=189913 RepID=UPI002125EAE9|nr:zinc finger protein 26-like [Leptidea sinapis]XP_050675564.1 zinc finger protein 26-like [Leptidea sinapis]
MSTSIKTEQKEGRKDPTTFLPEEPMTYEIKVKKKKKKRKQEDPFKDIEEKVKLPTVMVFDPSSDTIDPEVNIKVENIEVELDFNDFANTSGLMVEAAYSENSQSEPEVKLEQENKEALLLTFEELLKSESVKFENETNNEYVIDYGHEQNIARNYVCKVCHLVFQSPKTLRMHQKRKHQVFRKSFKHICDYCSMSYETKNSLIAHIRRKHGPNSTPDDFEERTCDICALVFKGMSRLRMHMRRKHGSFEDSFQHVCEHCGLTYDKLRSLIVHVKRKHSGHIKSETGQWYKCPFCPKIFSKRETYARHVQRNHKVNDDVKEKVEDEKINVFPDENDEVSCTECPLVFSSPNFLKLHMRRKHNALKEDFRLKCKICNLSYDKIESLKRHVRRKHDKGSYCFVCNRQFDTKELFLSHTHTKQIIECSICGLIFASRNGLSKHTRHLHHSDEPKRVFCHICNEGFYDKRQLKPHYMRVHLKVSYSCRFCNKVFKAKESYRRHIIVRHQNTLPNNQKCDHCTETFPDEFELSRHVYLVHHLNDGKIIKKEDGDKNGFQCTKCTNNYDSWEELRIHFEETHYSKSESQCQDCGELVPSNELQKHMQSVHVNNSMKCKFCEFTAKNRASMTQHMLRHKNATTLHCQQPGCRYKTFYEGAMDKHKRRHASQGVKLQCTKCPFQTMNKYVLKYHEEAHESGSKRYACDQCDYATVLPTNLVQHKYKHSKEKRFKCEVCPFATKYNTSLRFHVRKKHCDLPSFH